jgi:tetratricopeptide (TPR) repeat protein
MALNARGWILFKQGKNREAISDFDRALQYAPDLPLAYANRGVCYVKQNDFSLAVADHTRHLELDPESAVAYSNRAVAWLGMGEYQKTADDFKAAEKLAPELDEALNGYAWFLATCPDESFRNGKLAIEKSKKACGLTNYQDWYQLDTLAAAFAETGDFDSAVKWAKQALEIAPAAKKGICEQQLQRFQRKEPFRSKIGKNAEEGILGL